MNQRTIVFMRDGECLSVLQLVLSSADDTRGEDEVLASFRSALREWSTSTKDGIEAARYASDDFNIGDYTSYEWSVTLAAILRRNGIRKSTVAQFEWGELHYYDLPLLRAP